ncbi:deoxyribodipyrimidine photo-lyase [Porphyrobacter sp. GA68]|uniref:cryptochrome/photolyase family protein n=1 Tax=Porphyrobacter sp. GA68 TaxID=2883480 RepID=UPI001D190B79|nr:deoxyribodipyrimidine photo-lyase [Porphyrobacter sp. GA68]
MTAPHIVWFRRDLRLADQAALHHAASLGPVIPVFILDDERAGDRRYGGAHRWWLHHSLEALAGELERLGNPLVLRRGDSVAVLSTLAAETGAAAVHAIRHYEWWWQQAEDALATALPEGCDLHIHDGNYLFPPGSVATGAGQPYKIYGPFAKAAAGRLPPAEPLAAPDRLTAPDARPRGDRLADWRLLPARPDWAGGFRSYWGGKVGERAALSKLEQFDRAIGAYHVGRNLPSEQGSSQLSPHLHWGEISPATVWHHFDGRPEEGWSKFKGELIWRDFTQNIILQYPRYGEQNAREQFDRFPWRDPDADPGAAADLKAWQKGQTGYPIVDAGMRQLWAIGWMHNRVRMIVASFLVKHLLIDWRHGERWFWDTLVDADYANNAFNWQWIAGSGVDAQQFTRIMAPLTQSAKFDAAGYIREWVPELAGLSDADIHDPPAGIRPGQYPEPLIGHQQGRERALTAYRQMKAAG